MRLHGHAACVGTIQDRDRDRPVGTISPGSGSTRPTTAGSPSRTITSAYVCLGLWGPKAREILAPLTTDPLDFPYMRRRSSSRSAPCPAWHFESPTSVSWAGSSTARRSSGSGSGTRSGRPVASTGSSPAAYKAIDSLRLEKGYRVWGADITAGRHALRGRSRLRGQARQGLPREAGVARGR